MVTFQDIQTAYYMIAATGVLVAAIYYVFNMRATLQTRQAQMLMSLYQEWNEPQFQEAWLDIMSWQWKDYDDFQSKYSRVSNPNENRKLMQIGSFFEGLGVFIKRGFIDPRLVDDLMSLYIVGFWQKLEPVFFEMRKRSNSPTTGEYAEYLYKVIYDIWKQQHPETPTPYSP